MNNSKFVNYFMQNAKSGIPFNPLADPSGLDIISGANINRFQKRMNHFGWKDPRFISLSDAESNGWKIDEAAEKIDLIVRDQATGRMKNIELFNAANVIGIPSLDVMLAMSESEITAMRGNKKVGIDAQREDVDSLGEEFIISPVRVQKISIDNEVTKPIIDSIKKDLGSGSGVAAGIVGEFVPNRLNGLIEETSEKFIGLDEKKPMMVMASYWVNGLHNAEGIAAANELNKIIAARKLEEDKNSIERLIYANEHARKLGLRAVSKEVFLNDPDFKENRAEPRKLLQGSLVRDKDGSYRSAVGGKPLILDKGDSLALKSKGKETYQGAMELALAKGWTAIEIKGKPSMMAEIWLEAKMMNLDVVNYTPNAKDQEKLAARLAEMQRQKDAEKSRTAEQSPEIVEVHPFFDAQGQTKMATVTYTVSYEGGKDVSFDNPKEAASAFNQLDASLKPVVIRSVARADGVVQEAVVAECDAFAYKPKFDRDEDRELNEAIAEVVERAKNSQELQAEVPPVGLNGLYVGQILSIEGNRMTQRKAPGVVVWHDISQIQGILPKVGEVAEIGYSKGVGVVKEKTKEQEQEGGRERGR